MTDAENPVWAHVFALVRLGEGVTDLSRGVICNSIMADNADGCSRQSWCCCTTAGVIGVDTVHTTTPPTTSQFYASEAHLASKVGSIIERDDIVQNTKMLCS